MFTFLPIWDQTTYSVTLNNKKNINTRYKNKINKIQC